MEKKIADEIEFDNKDYIDNVGIFDYIKSKNIDIVVDKKWNNFFQIRDFNIELTNRTDRFWEEDKILKKKILDIKQPFYLIFYSYMFYFKSPEQFFDYMEKYDSFSREPFIISEDSKKQIRFHHEYLWGANF